LVASFDVDRVWLGDETVDRGRGVEILHRHLEAEVFSGLIANRFHDRIGHANMAQLDVFDFLRPDGRKAGDRAGACRAADQRPAGFEERTPRRTLLCSGPIAFHDGIPSRPTFGVWSLAHDCLPACNHRCAHC
jgi:hypothetical protein